jgi:transposase-like protein
VPARPPDSGGHGLKGLPDAVGAVWERTIVQTCIVHLLRNSFKYTPKRDWAEVAKDLQPVCTAALEAETTDRFAEFSGEWEKRHRAVIQLWENAGRKRWTNRWKGSPQRLRHHLRRPRCRQAITAKIQLHP